MIEEGIVKFVSSALADSVPGVAGGFLGELPKDQSAPGWTYLVVSDVPQTTLNGGIGVAMMRLQIDCYSPDSATIITLAAAINGKLHGLQGNLPDADQTYVSSCFRSDKRDFFDTAGRHTRRMIEFEIHYSSAAA